MRWFDKDLNRAKTLLQQVYDILNDIKEEQEEKNDNVPENFQSSERFERAEERVETFDEAISNVEEVIDNLENIE